MDKRFWIGFNLVKGIGAVRMRALMSYFDSLEEAWSAPTGQLQEAGLSPKLAEAVEKLRASVNLDRVLRRDGLHRHVGGRHTAAGAADADAHDDTRV